MVVDVDQERCRLVFMEFAEAPLTVKHRLSIKKEVDVVLL